MAEHMIQGRAAAEVIDDVEALFERTYENNLVCLHEKLKRTKPR